MPVPFALPPPDPGFEISLASRGVSQGVVQTDGVQIIPRAFVRIGAVQIGAQWKNVSNPSASGVAALFLRANQTFGETQIDARAAYRIRTGTQASADIGAWEFSGGASRRFGRLGLRINAEYSPKDFESGQSLYLEWGSTVDVGQATTISANLGRRERDRGPDYTSFNAGISRLFQQRLLLDGRYHRTNRSELGPRFQGRLVFSARLSF